MHFERNKYTFEYSKLSIVYVITQTTDFAFEIQHKIASSNGYGYTLTVTSALI